MFVGSGSYLKIRNWKQQSFLLLILLFSSASFAAEERAPQTLEEFHSLYLAVLKDSVYPGEKNGVPVNLVNYPSLRHDYRLNMLMKFLANYDYHQLESQSDRTAYFLNAYNIMAINKVCENWPLKSLRSLGNMFRPVWVHQCGQLNEEPMTLRVLENDILRQLGEPRIHFALNCASVSCPDLRAEPYTGERLERQLADQTRTFFRQQGKGMKNEGNSLWLTPLLDWFEEDFESIGGVQLFLKEYLPPAPEAGDWKFIGYLKYDWDVNCNLSGAEKRKIKARNK